MKTVVIMPGGFHPFHAGHFALYQQAQQAFPDAEIYVVATDDTSERPFPFALKQKLAQLSGVESGHFVRVKNPFTPEEITKQFDPDQTALIFVRSEKDRNQPPQPGQPGQVVTRGPRKGQAPYLQIYNPSDVKPMKDHAYVTYLPTVQFGPGITSATEIRTAWPGLTPKRKQAMVMSLYPRTRGNATLTQNVVGLLDQVLGTPEVDESADYLDEKWSKKYKNSINCSNPRGFSQRAHCAGRKK